MREQEGQRSEDQRGEACRAQATGRAISSGGPGPRGYRRQGQGAVPVPRSPACTRPTHSHASLHCRVLPPATPQAPAPASLLQWPNPPPLTLLPRTPARKNSSPPYAWGSPTTTSANAAPSSPSALPGSLLSPSPSDPKTETGHVARAREGADRPLHWLTCPLSGISGSPHRPGPRSEVSTVLGASCLPRPWFPRCGSSSHESSTGPPAAVQPLCPCGIFLHTHQTSQEGRAGPSPPSHTQGHCTPMRAGPRWAPTPLLLLRPGLWCQVGLTLLSPPVLGGARLKPELQGG